MTAYKHVHKNNPAIQWAIKHLIADGYHIVTYKKIIETAYSVIYQIKTSGGDYYLKKNTTINDILP